MTTQTITRTKKSPAIRQNGDAQQSPINIGWNERKLSMLAGGGLVVGGLARRSVGGVVAAIAGAMFIRRGMTGRCDVYKKLGYSTARDSSSAPPREYFEHGIHVEQSVTINKPASELYQFWRNFENFPTFMEHLKSVSTGENGRLHWVAKAPAGFSVEWDAEIINDEPDRLIAWRSIGEADVDNAGSVRFVDGPTDRGTEVHVVLDYLPPAGRVGAFIAKLFRQEPSIQIKEDLRRFKQLMETGEIATTQGQPRGTCDGGGEEHHGW